MPKGAEVLSVGVQFGKDVCLWVKINTDNELEDRKFNIYGTGHPIYKTDQRFIGTFQLFNGEGIFHLFE
ncbi:MAG: hypothetical protein WC516_06480 [Patescibacteria group bacterium]|jgi:hypothetical protein